MEIFKLFHWEMSGGIGASQGETGILFLDKFIFRPVSNALPWLPI